MADVEKLSTGRAQYPLMFVRAVARVLANEGGYVDNAADRGGETHFGISRRDYPALDIRNLTRDDAIAIYYSDFWLRARYAELPAPVAEKMFDLAVNIGLEAATRCLQRALRAAGLAVIEDGEMGDRTIAAAQSARADTLLAALRSEAAGHYRLVAMERRRSA